MTNGPAQGPPPTVIGPSMPKSPGREWDWGAPATDGVEAFQGLRRKIKLGSRNPGLREKWTPDGTLGPEREGWGPGFLGPGRQRGLGAGRWGGWVGSPLIDFCLRLSPRAEERIAPHPSTGSQPP